LSTDILAGQSRALKTRFQVTNCWQRRQKCTNLLSLWRNTQRTENPSRKNFFFDLTSKICRIQRVWSTL